jgi:hypothetical protein
MQYVQGKFCCRVNVSERVVLIKFMVRLIAVIIVFVIVVIIAHAKPVAGRGRDTT